METTKTLYICGAGGHGRVCSDIAKCCGYSEVVFVDDFLDGYLKQKDIPNGSDVFVGIGGNDIRYGVFMELRSKNMNLVNLMHPSSFIGNDVCFGMGVIVMPNVVVNNGAKIGDGVILNSSCVIEHDCVIGDFVHISPNSALAGGVKIGSFSHIGIGSCIIQNINIGDFCTIGAGSVVIRNLSKNVKAFGNPAKIRD